MFLSLDYMNIYIYIYIYFFFSPRFQVYYTVSQPTPEWDGYEDRVSLEMLLEILPPPPSAGHERELLICICGPDPFTHHIVRWENIIYEFSMIMTTIW